MQNFVSAGSSRPFTLGSGGAPGKQRVIVCYNCKVALDDALVALEKRLKIEKCNTRIEFSKPQREATYQVTLNVLKLSPCYPAFLIIAEVPEIYMHQFWNTIKKIKDTDEYWFKLDKQKFRIDTDVFCEILQICPRLPNEDFVEPPSEEKMVPFFKELGYTGKCDREISFARKEYMPYPRFTKFIINHFISTDKTISMRNRINLHTIRDDTLLGTLKVVSKTKDYQKYEALIPKEMINQAIKDSRAYKTYLDFDTRKAIPKKERKFKKPASPSKKQTLGLEDEPTKKLSRKKIVGVVIRDTLGMSMSKKKAQAKVDRGKRMYLISDVALLKAAQLKKVLKKSKEDTHMFHTNGSDDGFPIGPKIHLRVKTHLGGDCDNNDNDSNDDVDDDKDIHESDDDHDEDDDEWTKSDHEEEEKQDDEFVHTPDDYVPTDDEKNDESKEFDEKEYEELYDDVNISLKDVEPADKQKGDVEMT
nr:hypothetical protein [Tanacetum cinerariifolium]